MLHNSTEPKLKVVRHTSGIGATINGVDLTNPTSTATFTALNNAFKRYRLLVFKKQKLSVKQQITFSQLFGNLETFPTPEDRAEGHENVLRVTNIERDSDRIKPIDDPVHRSFTIGTSTWHIDSSFRRIPSAASILYAIEIPDEGGDTMFADTSLAYADMTKERKKELEKLVVLHDFEETRRRNNLPSRTTKVKAITPPSRHPLIVNHLDDRCAIYIGAHAAGIDGMTYKQARLFLNNLEEIATQPQYTYRHKWAPGDLIMYDNICVLHKAMSYNISDSRRLLHRTTIAGITPPIGINNN